MMREEAISWLTNEKWKNADNKYKKEWNEAFDMAIEALQGGDADMTGTSPYMQQSPDSGADLISRADAIEARPEYRNEDMLDADKANYNKGWNDCTDAWRAIINALPSADRPSGEWVRSGNTLICPICGAKGEDIKDDYCFNYCPNCGTYMRNTNRERR